MEIFEQCYTAEELYQILKKIPQAQRERLPLDIYETEVDAGEVSNIYADAFEVTETEGCIERGFRIFKGVV